MREACAALQEHEVVDVDGHGPMTRDEFIAYCFEHKLDNNLCTVRNSPP